MEEKKETENKPVAPQDREDNTAKLESKEKTTEPVKAESENAEAENAEKTAEPVKAESENAEAENAEKTAEPVKAESENAEAENAEKTAEPVKAEAENAEKTAEPVKTEPAKAEAEITVEPVKTEPAKTEAENAEKTAEPAKAEAENAEKTAEPAKAEAEKTEKTAEPAKTESQVKAEQEAQAKENLKAKAELEEKEAQAKVEKEAQIKAEKEALAKEIFEKMKPIQSLLGKKVGMTQVFSENGDCLPVTLLQLGPVEVIQKKTLKKDGYEAIKVGFEELPPKKAKKLIKPKQGQMSKTKSYRYLREVAVSEIEKIEIGQKFDVAAFQKGNFVDVIGISKGKGFAGVIKRHNFSGGPKSHGSHLHRSTGSIGASAYPARVFKNRKMPGHYGFSRVTVQNLQIVQIIREDNLLLIKGAVPGPNGRLVEVRRAIKKT